MVQRLAVLLSFVVVLVAAPSALAAAGPALTVDAGADRHPISPAIYGMNGADPALAAELHLPVDRWGGNDKERYNWLLATKNTGRDWFFENVADCFGTVAGCNLANPAADGAYRPMIARDRAAGGTTVMQIPLIGWVAKDRPVDHPFTCGFPQDPLSPVQASFDFYDRGCGNGREPVGVTPPVRDQPYSGGDEIDPGPPEQTSVPFGPAEAKAWVQDLVSRYGDAAHGGVGYYELGNEPNLWNDSHRDVHPLPTTFEELRDKSVAMAEAIKEADPTAKVIGFSEWGWTNYFCSAYDVAPLGYGCDATDPDRAAHDGKELSAWYLAEMKAASDTEGRRLLDDFDLHYYAQKPQTDDHHERVATDSEALAGSRSLWDPTYHDPSWIDTEIRLLPRMRAWVDANYPGTGISLSEYNLTDLGEASKKSVVGTLSEADALGIFARERVDMAAMWAPPASHDLVADAFRLYRNYDGAGGRFGDVWIRSASADQGQLAIYGAQRTSDGALTLAVVNKAATALEAPVAVNGFTAAGPTQVWGWTGDGSGIARKADLPIGTATASFPARSLTLLVLPQTATDDPLPPDPPQPDPPQPDPPQPDPPYDPPSDPPPGTPTTPDPPKRFPVPPSKPAPPLARLLTTKVVLHGRAITLRVSCPKGTLRCGGTLALRSGRTTLGTAKLALKAGRTTNVRLTFTRTRARTVAKYGRRGHAVKATITAGKRSKTTSLSLRGR